MSDRPWWAAEQAQLWDDTATLPWPVRWAFRRRLRQVERRLRREWTRTVGR